MSKILIIDDEEMMCELLSRVVDRLGHESAWAHTFAQGHQRVAAEPFDVVLLDVGLPDGNGLDLLPWIKASPYSPETIIITGDGDPDGAELAIKSGAWDYIEKAASIKEITLSLNRALKYIEQRDKHKTSFALEREGIVGNSGAIKICLDILAQAANSDANVLITGETGTGKELFARAIHRNSSRHQNGFVVLDCAALPETLVESMLFGHEKGAFTGADFTKEGLIMQAHGGTLFLDEVGELPLSIQKRFLRVLQEHAFRPLGGKQEIKSDFRLLAATNRQIEEMVENKQFRGDLLYRIQTITCALPPLRERGEDVCEIALHHLNKACKNAGVAQKGFSDNFFSILSAYHWPGNVRELVNTMERVLAEALNEPILFPKHLPAHIRVPAAREKLSKKETRRSDGPKNGASPDTAHQSQPKMKDYLDDMKEQYMKEVVLSAKGSVKNACKISGLSRAHLYQLLKKYHLALRD